MAEIVLREIARAGADLAELLNTVGVDGDAGADGGAIALGADQVEEYAVVSVVIGV